MKKNSKNFIWPLLMGMLIGALSIYGVQTVKPGVLINPLSSNPQILAAKVPSQKPVIGFLPYWNLNSAQIQYHLLDYICYFGVGINFDGSIKKLDDPNLEIGWLKLRSDELKTIFETADKQEVGRMIAFTAFNNEVIDTIIGSPMSQKKAIESIISIVREYELDAVNIDFEYNGGYPINSNPDDYVNFIKKLREEFGIQGMNDKIITVDLYANAFMNNSLYNAGKLSQYADWLVLMGYDFHQTSSTKAGPVAPLKSQTGKSITQALDAALKNNIKAESIVLAMPFYGYEWQTVDDQYNAATYPDSGAMASYRRISQLVDDKNIEPEWDHHAMSPWFSYNDENKIQQVYYENDQSIGYKLQLITQLQLQGAAIWALGYEGKDASVWNVIEEWRKNQN